MRYVVAEVGSWRVTHDASGKVLVRRFEKGEEVLFATARWQSGGTHDRKSLKPNVPSHESWHEIDNAVRAALEAAATMGPDPRLDPAELPPRKPEDKADGKEEVKPMGYFGLAITAIIVAALAFGLYKTRDYWLWIVQGSGDGANGEACGQDSDCRSDNCARKAPGAKSRVCVPNERKRGERCTADSECSSGSCERRVCN